MASPAPDPLGCRGSLGLTATLPFAQNSLDQEGRQPTAWRFAVSPQETTPAPARGEVLAQISTALVQLHSRYYGKGPTKAKTHQVNDTIISILRGGFTRVERTLIETGQVEPVHQMRRTFQEVMEDEFRRVVEDATGRKVIAYMSNVHTDPDLAIEIFLLEPLDGNSDGDPGGITDGGMPEAITDGHPPAESDGDGA